MAAPVQVGDVYLCNTTQTIQRPTNAVGNRQEPIVICAGSHIEIVRIVDGSAFTGTIAGYKAIRFATEPRVEFYIPDDVLRGRFTRVGPLRPTGGRRRKPRKSRKSRKSRKN